jgi:hypothetical protein
MDLKDFRPSNNVEDDRPNPPGWLGPLYTALSFGVPPVAVRKALQLSDWLGLSPRLGIAPPMWNLSPQPAPPGSLSDQLGANQIQQAERPRLPYWPRAPLPPNLGGGSAPIPNLSAWSGTSSDGQDGGRGRAGSIADMVEPLFERRSDGHGDHHRRCAGSVPITRALQPSNVKDEEE